MLIKTVAKLFRNVVCRRKVSIGSRVFVLLGAKIEKN
jgi:hypothetical protein